MLKWLKKYDSEAPMYLCMESKDIWKTIGNFSSTKEIENYLIKQWLERPGDIKA